jgi:hypothetical protein
VDAGRAVVDVPARRGPDPGARASEQQHEQQEAEQESTSSPSEHAGHRSDGSRYRYRIATDA